MTEYERLQELLYRLREIMPKIRESEDEEQCQAKQK